MTDNSSSSSAALDFRRQHIIPSRKAWLCAGVALVALLAGLYAQPSFAQGATHAKTSHNIGSKLSGDMKPDEKMMLQSDVLKYDFDNDIVSASGTVQIYYGDYTLEADRVVYDRKNGQMKAYGHVRMTEPDGNVVHAAEMQLSEDFAQGFASAIQLDTADRTRVTADRVTRSGGNTTTMENGLYTVYTHQKDPVKPPLWRIKATKIVHNQQERTMYFHGARLEFFGKPIAYVPYFQMPDPSVKRKSGFLIPTGVFDSKLGAGVTIPYYWALSPNYDLTTRLTPLTKQGVLTDVTWRQKLINGSYSIAAAGLFQSDPSQFVGHSGDRRFRGAIHTTGEFNLNKYWKWGWDITHKSDRRFLSDYDSVSFGDSETSQIYFSGNSLRNSFSVRAYAFSISQEDYGDDDADNEHNALGFSRIGDDLQDKQPYVLPVVDYNYVYGDPVAGGELSFDSNFTSLTRDTTDAYLINGTNRFRGVDGTFSRASVKTEWRRTLIDPIGQVFTPFAYVRGDLFFLNSADKSVDAMTDEAFVGRAMPAVGIDYRYPFISTFKGGNQVVEPVAQLIVRPNEQNIGKLPNDDSQSLVFDTTSLFEYDKFSGYDRAEGGTRANVGLNYKLQFDNGQYLSMLAGQSFHLAGKSSYDYEDLLNSTADSGLETDDSDYVGSMFFNTGYGIRFGTQGRFDHSNFSTRRFQTQATGTYGPVSGSLAYAFLGKQPDAGIDDDRQEILGSANLRLSNNWRLFSLARYDIENYDWVQDGVGLGYDDEGFSLSMSYSEDRSENDGDDVDRKFYVRVGLRTIGSTQFDTSLDN